MLIQRIAEARAIQSSDDATSWLSRNATRAVLEVLQQPHEDLIEAVERRL